MKITLAIPTNRGVKPKTVGSLLSLVNASKEHDFHVLIAEQGYTTAENRNYCVVQALKNNSDYLLFIDDDMTFPPETLNQLLSHGKDIVGVASNSRVLPKSPTVGLMDKDGNYKHPDKYPSWEMKIPDELFKCFFVGGGVLLIKMSIFSVINKPWFKFESNDDGKIIRGEDGWFCDKARTHGFDVWCDPKIEIGHIGDYIY